VSIEPEIKYEGFDVGPLVGGGLGPSRRLSKTAAISMGLSGITWSYRIQCTVLSDMLMKYLDLS